MALLEATCRKSGRRNSMRRMTMPAGWFVWKSLRVEKSQKALPPQIRAWVEARKRHRLSHAQVQMARELGLNPGKLGKISNHRQEPWKAPLPQFIEHLYLKRFGREQPRSSLRRRTGGGRQRGIRRGMLSLRTPAVTRQGRGRRDRA
jgi:hypothetical protein